MHSTPKLATLAARCPVCGEPIHMAVEWTINPDSVKMRIMEDPRCRSCRELYDGNSRTAKAE
jgi:hypothetical protein